MAKNCGECGTRPRKEGQWRCGFCHAAYMRQWRKLHPYSGLTEEQKHKIRCRAYTNSLLGRGLLERGPCGICGAERTQARHIHYDDPRAVVWRCKAHWAAIVGRDVRQRLTQLMREDVRGT